MPRRAIAQSSSMVQRRSTIDCCFYPRLLPFAPNRAHQHESCVAQFRFSLGLIRYAIMRRKKMQKVNTYLGIALGLCRPESALNLAPWSCETERVCPAWTEVPLSHSNCATTMQIHFSI